MIKASSAQSGGEDLWLESILDPDYVAAWREASGRLEAGGRPASALARRSQAKDALYAALGPEHLQLFMDYCQAEVELQDIWRCALYRKGLEDGGQQHKKAPVG